MSGTLKISRDGTVTYQERLGFVWEEKVEHFVKPRYFHGALPKEGQRMGHGYQSKREAAEALAKVKTAKAECAQ